MRRKSIILLFLILVLSVIPVTYVVAGSASCSGSGPYACVLQDAFNFFDNSPTILLGLTIHIPTDSFHFLDSSLRVVVSGGSQTNVFTQTTTTNSQNIITATSSITGQLITEIVFPLVFIFVVIGVAAKLGVKENEFPILLGLVVFAFGGLIYAKLLPTFLVLFPILFAGAAVSLLVSKFLGSRGSGEG